MTWTSSALVLERGALDDFSITRSYILREMAFARRLTPQWCAFETISVGCAKACTRDFLLILKLYHFFCYFVGGVISPLLANIALHGMEDAIGVKYNCRGELIGKRAVVRYADDFLCFTETKEDAEQVQSILVEWLRQRGLTLSPEKTRIVHLTEGFNFLGFNVRHYRAPQTTRSGWKLLIKREPNNPCKRYAIRSKTSGRKPKGPTFRRS